MMAINETERGEIEDMLPWHAAGTLSAREAARVEAAIASDAELARRFALVREELAETIHVNEAIGVPSARIMDKLFAAIDAEPARAQRAPGFAARVLGFFDGLRPRTLVWSSAIAALAIILQAGVITNLALKPRAHPVRTGSAPRERKLASRTHSGTFLWRRAARPASGPGS